MVLVAAAAASHAAITNTFQFGGDSFFRDRIWANVSSVNTNVTPREYSWNITPGSSYVALSNLVITVMAVETNNTMLAFDSYLMGSGGNHPERLDSYEAILFKVSYSDPDHKLLGLRLAEFGTFFNTGADEIMVFSDGVNSFSLRDTENIFQQDYNATGLTPLTKDNTNTWFMLVSVDDTFGTTQAGMGAFKLEYIADDEVVVLPPDPPFGNVLMGDHWVNTPTIVPLVDEASYFSLVMNSGTSDNRYYQRAPAHFSGAPFQMGETLTISFTAMITTNKPLTGLDRAFRFSVWEELAAGLNGFSGRVDYGEVADDTTYVGSGAIDRITIGETGGTGILSSTDVPSNPLQFQGDESDIQMVIKRTADTDFNVSVSYDDVTVSNSYEGVTFSYFSGMGFRLNINAENSFSVTNFLAVITNPDFDYKYYEIWAEDNGLTFGDNDAYGDDPDSDGMQNLLEYALGADPLVGDAATFLPEYGSSPEGGTNWLNYVYRRRLDHADRGLSYVVSSTLDLVYDPLTNATMEVGSVALDADYESVTNRVSMEVEPARFMQLKVTGE